MIYILIMILQGSGYGNPTTVVAEFNDLASCQAASSEIVKQLDHTSIKGNPPMVCAQKGKAK